ncbi:hypothetical protein LXL04_010398 [Taraxacum kok-saghyz]
MFVLRMGRFMLTFALVVMVMAVEISRSEQVNQSASEGLYWSTANGNAETDESLNDHDELDGGFPSLDGMLQWAIGHSDPAKLELKARDVQQLSTDELQKRQKEIKELVERLETPSDAKLMRIAIDDLNNSSITLDHHLHALEELLILVESIDNANDLHKLGGLDSVIQKLNNPNPEIRLSCAWIIGKASQNNPIVQNQVIELGALPKLITMVKSSSIQEEAIKALYAVSAVIRNNQNGLKIFYSQNGDLILQAILTNTTADVRLHKRSVSLIADLAEYHLHYSNPKLEVPFFSSCGLVTPLINLATSGDLHLKEKVLLAVKNLLMIESSEVLVVDGFCGLDGVLEKMRGQLEEFMKEESQREYAVDVDGVRKEVELIYVEKLNKFTELALLPPLVNLFYARSIVSDYSFPVQDKPNSKMTGDTDSTPIKEADAVLKILPNSSIPISYHSLFGPHDDLLLLELDEKLLPDVINQKVSLRGQPNEDAVLCTHSKTYALKFVGTSNSVFLVPPPHQYSVDEKTPEINSASVLKVAPGTMELVEVAPKIDKLKLLLSENPYKSDELNEIHETGLYQWDDLINRVQASDEELRSALKVLPALEINGYWRIIDFKYMDRILNMLINNSLLNDWPLNSLNEDDVIESLVNDGFPRLIARHCLEVYGSKTDGGSVWQLDERRVCVHFAKGVLLSFGKMKMESFMKEWSRKVPGGMVVSFEMLEGEVLVEKLGIQCWVYSFSVSSLPSDPGNRFSRLFQERVKWEWKDLQPYIRDLSVPGLTSDGLLLKYTRRTQPTATSEPVFTAR